MSLSVNPSLQGGTAFFMIILIHGTGDDNTKDENWIKWVGKVAARHGNLVLEIPGVASSEQDSIGTYVSQFMMKLPPAGTASRPTRPRGSSRRSAAGRGRC